MHIATAGSRHTDCKPFQTAPDPKTRGSWHTSVTGNQPQRTSPRRRGSVLNALAFSTLLSSQGTDAHHQQPHGRLQGNYSNLPDAFPPVKSKPLKDFEETSGRSARPQKPYPIPAGACARYPEIEFVPRSRQNRFAERHLVPVRGR